MRATYEMIIMNTKKHQDVLEEVVSQEVLPGLSVVYYRQLSDNNDDIQGYLITKAQLDKTGMTEEDLYHIAKMNQMEKMVYRSMEEVISEILGTTDEDIDIPELDENGNLQEKELPMHILTNREKLFGAALIAIPEVMKQIAVIHPQGYYVLPSSVHEVIIVPKQEEIPISVQELAAIVQDMNQSVLAEAEFLSDNIYEFDTRLHKLAVAYDAEGVLAYREGEQLPDKLLEVPEIKPDKPKRGAIRF